MATVCPICGTSANSSSSTCFIASQLRDEERMAFLTSYPAPNDNGAREQIISFWSKAVAHAFEHASCLAVEPKFLVTESLAWGDLTAPGLELAMAHMLSKGELVLRNDVEVAAGLARRSMMEPLVYLMGIVRLSSSRDVSGKNLSGQYLHRGVLESLSEELAAFCKYLPDHERTVYLFQEDCKIMTGPSDGDEDVPPWCFRQLCRAAGAAASAKGVASRLLSSLDGDDLALLAGYLVRTKRAIRKESIVKVTAMGKAVRRWTSANGECSEISETDIDLLGLRCTVGSLKANASDLRRRMDLCRKKALRESHQGEKQAALVYMRRMKQLQAAREKLLSSLLTLETVLDQVKQLHMDKQVLEAHEAATKALRSCREAHGLTVERVEDTLDALAEEMSTQRDINSALADADNVFQDSNERTELEAELADLLRGEGDVSDCPQAAADTITVESGVTVDTSTGAITDGRIGGASDRPILTSTRHEVGSKDELHVERLPAEPKRVAALSATAT